MPGPNLGYLRLKIGILRPNKRDIYDFRCTLTKAEVIIMLVKTPILGPESVKIREFRPF